MVQKSYDIVILGAGQAGRRAAEGVRSVSRAASIALIGDEPHAPYDRPPLSKEALIKSDGAALCDIRPLSFYETEQIDLYTSERATSLDVRRREVQTANGDGFLYRKLVIATGSRPKPFVSPPLDDDLVRSLRTKEDAAAIASRLRPGALVIIVGAGFIGLEVASAAVARGAHPVVIEAADRILGRVAPRPISERIAAMHRAAGMELLLGAQVESVARRGDKMDVAAGGRRFLADLMVCGIGVTPNTEIAEVAGVAVEDGVLVTEGGRSISHSDIFGAGEVTRLPVPPAGDRLRLESWQIAEQQAFVAGANAAGGSEVYDVAPWFWSDQNELNFQLLGSFPTGGQCIERPGDEGRASFFSVDHQQRLVGAATLNAGADMSIAKRLLGRVLDLDMLANTAIPLRQLMKSSI